MIESNRQYQVTKNRYDEFKNALTELENSEEKDEFLTKVMMDSIKSYISKFEKDMKEYESRSN